VGERLAASGKEEPWSQQNVTNLHITAFQCKAESYIYCGVPTKLRQYTWNSKGRNTLSRNQCYSFVKRKTISHLYEGAVPHLTSTSYIRSLVSTLKCRYAEVCPNPATARVVSFLLCGLVTYSVNNLHCQSAGHWDKRAIPTNINGRRLCVSMN
jgi:ribosomal protein L37E